MKKQVTGILLAAVIFTAFSCKSTKESEGNASQGGQPSVAEIFQQMDASLIESGIKMLFVGFTIM